MPRYKFDCYSCGDTTNVYKPMAEGPLAHILCRCGDAMCRDFSGVRVIAFPIAFQEHNRVSDDERKMYEDKRRSYEIEYSNIVAPKTKPKVETRDLYGQACQMFNSGAARGVTHAQAAAEGIA